MNNSRQASLDGAVKSLDLGPAAKDIKRGARRTVGPATGWVPVLSGLACAMALLAGQPPAFAQVPMEVASPAYQLDIPSQDLHAALQHLALASGHKLLYRSELVAGKTSAALSGSFTIDAALQALLAGTSLTFEITAGSVVLIRIPGETGAAGTGGRSALPVPADPVQPDSAGDVGISQLSSVVVTARKRDERQIDVPIAVSTTSGEYIDAFGISKVADIISMTPAASSVDTGGGRTQVQIRGVSSSLGGNDNGYYLDDIPFTGVTVPWYPDARSFDIERVEILKGPQGTLFGEGSMGGTVRVLTRKPDFNFFNAGIELGASTTETGGSGWAGKAMVNVPLLEDRLAARVAVTNESLPGWVDNIATGDSDINEQRVKTGRLKLRFAPTDHWNMDFAYWKYDSKAPGGGNNSDDDLNTRSFIAITDEWEVISFSTTYDFTGSQLFYAFADGDLHDVTDGMANPTTPYQSIIDIAVRTHELRWSSTGESNIDWTVGYYLREAGRDDGASLGGAPPSISTQTNDAHAIFGETTFRLPNPAWALTTGLRYFRDEVAAQSQSAGRTSVLNATFDSWNPRVSLSYKPAADTTLYASAARGFRSGQLQPITSILLAEANGIDLPVSVKPDAIMTYEVGGKTVLAEDKLLLEGALFYSDWKDVAVRMPVSADPPINGLMSSEGTRTRGAEFNLLYTPIRSLTLQLGGSIIDATYLAPVANTPIVNGTPVYNVPKLGLNASGAYTWTLGNGLDAVVRLAARHDSARKTPLSTGTPGDALTFFDARIGLESVVGWSVFAYGENLTNEDGAINARSMSGVANHPRPRSYGVVLRYNY